MRRLLEYSGERLVSLSGIGSPLLARISISCTFKIRMPIVWFEFPVLRWKESFHWLKYVYTTPSVSVLFSLSVLLEPSLGLRIPYLA